MESMRSMNARTLTGGLTAAPSASAKKVPNRPSESTSAIVQPPTASNGRNVGASGRSGMRAAVDSQSPEGEILRVQVVLQIEDPREARPVPERILPRAIGVLRPQQVVDTALDDRAARAPGREEPEQRPRGLARNRLADARELVVVVALARLAPATVLVLMTLEPANRALDVFVTRILADRGEATQHGPRAVDVVHAPATEPRPVVPLRMTEKIDRSLSGLEVLPITERAEQLEPAPRQVLRRRIEQRAVVGEGDVVQIEAGVLSGWRRPSPRSAPPCRGAPPPPPPA